MYLHRFISNSRQMLAAAIIFSFASQAGAVCYINAGATGTGDGSSWADASTHLQTALTKPTCNEIWVAKGAYKPVLPVPDRTNSFNVLPGTALYGGFAGNETNRDSRNPAENLTVLSGDNDDNDAHFGDDQIDRTSADIVGDNSYHVLILDGRLAPGFSSSTVIDGFTITGGSADHDRFGGSFNSIGGGLFCDGRAPDGVCSPTLSNLIFSGNRALEMGGALSNFANNGVSSPLLFNVIFRGNSASYGSAVDNEGANGGNSSPTLQNVLFENNIGSAMLNHSYNVDGTSGGTSNPVLSNVTFLRNQSGQGGAMENYADGASEASPILSNVTFVENLATSSGGAISNYAEVGSEARARLTNVTFSGNVAVNGAVMLNARGAHPVFENVIMWNNRDDVGGISEIYDVEAEVTIDHSVMEGGCPDASSHCTNLSTMDPLLGSLANYGGFTPTLRPGVGGSAIDGGNNASCPATDQRDLPRLDGHCDIGAVEVQAAEDIIFKDNYEAL